MLISWIRRFTDNAEFDDWLVCEKREHDNCCSCLLRVIKIFK